MSGIREVGFGNDAFGKPLVLSEPDSLTQIVSNIFTAKPGNFPSNPRLGIDINSKLMYMSGSDIEISELQTEIEGQLSTIIPRDMFGNVICTLTSHKGMPLFLVKIPLVSDSGDVNGEEVVAGFTFNNEKDKDLIQTINYLSNNQTKY